MNHDDASVAALLAQIEISFSGIRATLSPQVLRAIFAAILQRPQYGSEVEEGLLNLHRAP